MYVGSQMQDRLATGQRDTPVRVAADITHGHRRNLQIVLRRPRRAAHFKPARLQLLAQVPTDESRGSRNQDRAHHDTFAVQYARRRLDVARPLWQTGIMLRE